MFNYFEIDFDKKNNDMNKKDIIFSIYSVKLFINMTNTH